AIIAKKLGARHDLEHIRRSALMNSLSQSGATDWADLKEQLHFIADLFRCYHEAPVLFNAPFTPEQIAALKPGRIPKGEL
ncbi:MAG: hypothetical protein ICV79_27515, partial [Flavisolibacter sp.]|nr:hypothetical protein [Flavisolibacter sp.]